MSDATYKNIRVKEPAFEQLKEEKPEGVTWGYYLTEIRTVDSDD